MTTKFMDSITRGFAAVGEPDVAVCLRPGTELVFDSAVEYDDLLGVAQKCRLASNTARFRQMRLDQPHTHHDALEFADGQIILLTRLCEGQHATVLQLPSDRQAADEASAPAQDPFTADRMTERV